MTFALITGPTATGNSVSPSSPDSGPTARAVDPVVPDESSLSRRQHIETCVDIPERHLDRHGHLEAHLISRSLHPASRNTKNLTTLGDSMHAAPQGSR
jgi:hypothetical protein